MDVICASLPRSALPVVRSLLNIDLLNIDVTSVTSAHDLTQKPKGVIS